LNPDKKTSPDDTVRAVFYGLMDDVFYTIENNEYIRI